MLSPILKRLGSDCNNNIVQGGCVIKAEAIRTPTVHFIQSGQVNQAAG